jgi:HSP20 family molecular chaperone IbpA
MPAADVALGHLKKVLARDPMLRDVLAGAIPGLGDGASFVPSTDVVEAGGVHVLLLDVPGVPRDRIRVRLEGARLVIEGERPAPRVEGGVLRTSERAHGPFKREFLLPPDVDGDGVRASLDDGVLRVEVPRRGGGAAREVPVTPGG